MHNLYYDLHMHSCLSPCGDKDMTPANIAGMAALKGLNVVALTDHNTCRNCGPFLKCCEEYGLVGIPGMEINTMEEVHAVCLFRNLEAALDFDSYVYEKLQKVKNRPDIFGRQIQYGDEDQEVGEEPNLLINATDISFDELSPLVKRYDGAMFPAHIDKTANSLIANLGFIPEGSDFKVAELKNIGRLHELRKQHPYLEGCKIISNSDAHYLEHINEPELTLTLEEASVDCVIEFLSK